MARPKGTPKTGGRRAGTPNKKTIWLRSMLEAEGFVWEREFIKAYEKKNYPLLGVLQDLLPFLTPKVAEKELIEDKPADQSHGLEGVETAQLLALVAPNGTSKPSNS